MSVALTVGEFAAVTGDDRQHVYYLIRMCVIDAFKVRTSWRISVDAAEEYYDKRQIQGNNRTGIPVTDNGYAGRNVLSAYQQPGRIQAHGRRQRNPIMERRRRNVVCSPFGRNSVYRQKRECVNVQQLMLPF
jgi:hypothetical protein